MSRQFLKKWQSIASERIVDLEKFKAKKKEMYVVNGNISYRPRLERELVQIDRAIEFNKEIVSLLKIS